MGTDGDDVMQLAMPLFVGMIEPLSAEEAMKKLRGPGVSMVNRVDSVSLCQNCSGCEICANTWDANAVYDGCFKVPAIPVKRAAQDKDEAGPSKKAVDDYWFCQDDDVEVHNIELDSQDDQWLCEAAAVLEAALEVLLMQNPQARKS